MATKVKDQKSNTYYHIHTVDIISTAADAALGCYGVIRVADKQEIRDELVSKDKKGKIEEGVLVARFPDHTFAVTVNLILVENLKVTETLRETQKQIKYVFDKKYPKRCRYVSVYGVGLDSINK